MVEQLIFPIRPTMNSFSWPRISTATEGKYIFKKIYINPFESLNLKLFLPLISVSCIFDVPMELATLHEYSPTTSAKLPSMVSVFLYVEVILFIRVCVREYVAPSVVRVSPSFVHVTLVGGEPVEVQVRVEREEEMWRCIASTRGTAEGNSNRFV